MRAFVSHASQDKPQVEALAAALRERGIEAWLDKWEMGPGNDLVAKINDGLARADAGLIVYSAATAGSKWVTAESSYLIWAAIEEGKALIPVVIGDDRSMIPPLVRPRLYCRIDDVDRIADAVLHRRAGPPPVRPASEGHTETVVVALAREEGIHVEVRLGEKVLAGESFAAVPTDVARGHEAFQRGFRSGVRRDPTTADREMREAELAELGRALRPLCLPGDADRALTDLVDGSPLGTTVEVRFESADSALLGLPFEALRLPDDRLLAVHPKVVIVRRPLGLPARPWTPLAGPLKVLVAVGAPDEDKTPNVVLDLERELQSILDAVEEARTQENVEVRILEVGSPKEIGKAIERDAYHVLHLSCHGEPGKLELEDEEGQAVRVTAAELLAPIQSHGRPLPMVFLNSCHGATRQGETASLAEELLRAGVPCVLAMQTTVSDHHATLLAGRFYRHLARRDAPRASRALAEARRELEDVRREEVHRGSTDSRLVQPEYATPALFLARDEPPLMNPSLARENLLSRPVYEVSGPVPQLRIDDLIGRRKELRHTLRTLRDPAGRHPGVVLTGIGGVGKSAVAGRAMQRLTEEGWIVVAHRGRLDVAAVTGILAQGLAEHGRAKLAEPLLNTSFPDAQRFAMAAKTLAQNPILLVLDDFEQNLGEGGGAFLDPDTTTYLGLLAQNARRGRLLVTCRYPLPGFEATLQHLSLGPLSLAESRKLLLRLESLRDKKPAELQRILRIIGGHPRMLELLDALLRGGEGRLVHVTAKLQALLEGSGVDPKATVADLDESLQQALQLGARDVMLEQLLAVARDAGTDEALLQLAVSNLPVTPTGLARMLADVPTTEEQPDPAPAEQALGHLARLSLVFRLPDGAGWVHRWTAEGLARLGDEVDHRRRCQKAGTYRWWRVGNESHDLGDAVEAVRNLLQAHDFDAATFISRQCFDALRRLHQSAGIAALAAEVLDTLPLDHGRYAPIADEEAKAHLALGWTDRALERYRGLLALHQERAALEPTRTDYQRDLSVSYNKMGDLFRALGLGEEARQHYQQSLNIIERIAKAEPDRTDYQRDLSVSYNKMGDLFRALGLGEEARQHYQQSLDIIERIAKAEPDRTDYQRDLSVSYERIGDLFRARGLGEQARQHYQQCLNIRERLAKAEPDRTDYQRDLSVSYNKMGDSFRALGLEEEARQHYQQSLDIRERLAKAEPDRTDYQRDLSVSYERIGDLFRALGIEEQARQHYQRSLDIVERLARSEPERADYRQDLATSLERIGDIHIAEKSWSDAREAFLEALRIREGLADAEPGRADYQVELWVPLTRLGFLEGPAGRPLIARAIAILEELQSQGRLAPQHLPRLEAARETLSVLEEQEGEMDK